MVIRPVIRKSKQMERDQRGGEPMDRGGNRKLPTREGYILIGERLGVPRERSEAEYDKFVAERRAKRGG